MYRKYDGRTRPPAMSPCASDCSVLCASTVHRRACDSDHDRPHQSRSAAMRCQSGVSRQRPRGRPIKSVAPARGCAGAPRSDNHDAASHGVEVVVLGEPFQHGHNVVLSPGSRSTTVTRRSVPDGSRLLEPGVGDLRHPVLTDPSTAAARSWAASSGEPPSSVSRARPGDGAHQRRSGRRRRWPLPEAAVAHSNGCSGVLPHLPATTGRPGRPGGRS